MDYQQLTDAWWADYHAYLVYWQEANDFLRDLCKAFAEYLRMPGLAIGRTEIATARGGWCASSITLMFSKQEEPFPDHRGAMKIDLRFRRGAGESYWRVQIAGDDDSWQITPPPAAATAPFFDHITKHIHAFYQTRFAKWLEGEEEPTIGFRDSSDR